MHDTYEVTYIADTRRPLGQVIEGAADVKQSHVDAVQQRLEEDHSRQTRSPLGLRQQPHRPLHPSPQPGIETPRPGRRRSLPSDASAALLPAFQLVLQGHQDLVEEVRKEGVAEDEEALPGLRGDSTLGRIHLDDVDILLAQSLTTWRKRRMQVKPFNKTRARLYKTAFMEDGDYLRMSLNRSMQDLTAALSLSSSPAMIWILQKEQNRRETQVNFMHNYSYVS